MGSLLLSPGFWCTQGSVCTLQESVYPILCEFWGLYGGVNGDLLQEGLYHTQIYCTQSPCPCSSPLLTRTSAGDTQTQFCLSLCGVPGSWCAQALFVYSEHLWLVWVLIVNMILPLLPSCWGFSFALGCEVFPHSHSSAYRLTGVSLTLDVGYLLRRYGSAVDCCRGRVSGCSRPGYGTSPFGEVTINPTIELPSLTQDWGNRLWKGANRTLCVPGPRRKEQ